MLAAGKTLPEVEAVVRDAINQKEKTTVPVTVRLLARPGNVFYVLGEVNAPGAFAVTGHDTVLSAITAAGGPTRRASEQNIVLARPSVPEGCRTVLPVCYTNIVQLGDTTTNYQLRAGDRVYVPSKGMLESFLGGRCQRDAGPCTTPQVPCFGGGCAPAGGQLGAPIGNPVGAPVPVALPPAAPPVAGQ